jgi:hypothetical protein
MNKRTKEQVIRATALASAGYKGHAADTLCVIHRSATAADQRYILALATSLNVPFSLVNDCMVAA